ncbi:MAG: hypothetical protein NVV70_16995 [Cellulomonas sp.]|nr:hypothetical protein [Cellulomonas sp.]MCR6649744.1 hypothetical protein [Cellulomonas sp.]
MNTPTKFLARVWSAVCRRWDDRMQVAAPDTPLTVWFPEDGFVEPTQRDPFRDAPTAEMRYAMTRCTGHGGVTSVRYCEHASCVAAMAAREVARLEQMGDAA